MDGSSGAESPDSGVGVAFLGVDGEGVAVWEGLVNLTRARMDSWGPRENDCKMEESFFDDVSYFERKRRQLQVYQKQ